MKFPPLEVMNGLIKASLTPPVLNQTFALKPATETHFLTRWFHGQPGLLFNGDKNKNDFYPLRQFKGRAASSSLTMAQFLKQRSALQSHAASAEHKAAVVAEEEKPEI